MAGQLGSKRIVSSIGHDTCPHVIQIYNMQVERKAAMAISLASPMQMRYTVPQEIYWRFTDTTRLGGCANLNRWGYGDLIDYQHVAFRIEATTECVISVTFQAAQAFAVSRIPEPEREVITCRGQMRATFRPRNVVDTL